MREASWGGLRVRVTGGKDRDGGGAGPIVVLMHGYGAPGDDLVALSRVLDVPPETRFVFPQAPIDLGPTMAGGRAWWTLDLPRLVMRMERDPEALAKETPQGLSDARGKIVAMLNAMREELGEAKIVLGGFSQGAMLACDVAMRESARLSGLVLLSGAPVSVEAWAVALPGMCPIPIFQSHGAYDPMLPFEGAEALRDLLARAGGEIEWVPFRGQHEIPGVVLERLGAFLRRICAMA